MSDEMLNFTPRAQQALSLARQEAARLNHNFTGTEHLLLGLIRLGQGTAVTVPGKFGVDLAAVRAELQKHFATGPDQKVIGNIPTLRAERQSWRSRQRKPRRCITLVSAPNTSSWACCVRAMVWPLAC